MQKNPMIDSFMGCWEEPFFIKQFYVLGTVLSASQVGRHLKHTVPPVSALSPIYNEETQARGSKWQRWELDPGVGVRALILDHCAWVLHAWLAPRMTGDVSQPGGSSRRGPAAGGGWKTGGPGGQVELEFNSIVETAFL